MCMCVFERKREFEDFIAEERTSVVVVIKAS